MADFNFIQLTFDGVKSTDLNLYVVSNSGRYTAPLSPQFENRTTSVPGRSGLLYWGTDLGIQEFTISLATNGITGKNLNTFKKTFVPGKIGNISFPESGYRYSRVMLSAPPTLSFVPFGTESGGLMHNLYKGEIELQLTTLEPYSYSFNNIHNGSISNISKEESGLPSLTDFPATATIYHVAKNGRISNRAFTNSKVQALYSIVVSHAGNAPAMGDITFTRALTLNAESGSTGPRSSWMDITIGESRLIKPQFIVDIEFALQSVYTAWSSPASWTEKKSATLNLLREELYGPHRNRLIALVNASGAGLTYATFVALRTQVATEFFTNVKYRFHIQGRTNQCRLDVINLNTTPDILYSEDCAGAFNGRYPIIAPGGILPVLSNQQVFSSNIALADVEVYFENTYV